MQSELSRSRFAQETLEQSTAALADLGEHYTNLNTLLANSRSLLTSLVKSQKSDTWYLETAFYILVTTIIWLVFRRFHMRACATDSRSRTWMLARLQIDATRRRSITLFIRTDFIDLFKVEFFIKIPQMIVVSGQSTNVIFVLPSATRNT